jgi:CHRD domain-containing protein
VRLVIVTLLAAALALPPLAAAGGGGSVALRTTLTGRAAVPRGARHGRALASVVISGRRVCWSIRATRGIGQPRAAFIDKAIPGEFGPVMLRLGKRYRSAGCATARAGVAHAIALSPQGFYLSVNTRRYPLGAVRGQLRRA